MVVRIVFETHSITVDNERGIATGWLGGELSSQGRRLAAALGERRRADGVAAAYTSDLHRAVQTAAIAFAGSGIPVHVDARLRECDYGDWNGAPVARFDGRRGSFVAEPFPGGESYRDVVDRTASLLRDLSRDRSGGRIVLIGHSANRWALDHLLRGESLEKLVDAPFAWREGWEYLLP